MQRRRILIIAAAAVAALGAVLVLLYARSADARAEARFETTTVLVASGTIDAGETLAQARAAGKVSTKALANDALVPGYQRATADTAELDALIAQTTLYPGEQIISSKFGTTAAPASSLQIPDEHVAVSVNLTDPARVAGFVSPGSQVNIYLNATDPETSRPFTQLLLDNVTVIGVGSTTPISTTTTEEATGTQTTEQLPRTLLTLALSPTEAQRVLFGQANGELAVALRPSDDHTALKRGPATTFDNVVK